MAQENRVSIATNDASVSVAEWRQICDSMFTTWDRVVELSGGTKQMNDRADESSMIDPTLTARRLRP